MSADRACEKAMELKARIASHKCDPVALSEAQQTLREIARSPDADNRARVNAASFLLKHDWEVLNYEAPQAQQVKHSGIPDRITIEIVKSTTPPPIELQGKA